MVKKRASTAKKASSKKGAARKIPRPWPPAGGARIAGIGSDAVKNATGKGWEEWLALLDEAGARVMEHPAIATLLREVHKVPGWWAQMVTVGYEQARGLREKHQTTRGFEVSKSRTIAAPAGAVFAAWKDGRRRARWLADPITIRASTSEKSLRVTWADGTRVDVGLSPKGPSKTQVHVQHARLADARAALRMKAYWGVQLDRLQELLEA